MELTPLHTPDADAAVQTGQPYTVISYNIGFGAYEPDYGFFMDGGAESRAWSRERVTANVQNIAAFLKERQADFYLLQEVDIGSTRTYQLDEREALYAALFDKCSVFAQNYDSPYLMYPLNSPHGASRSGLLTFSRADITAAERVELPVESGFMKLLDLDRCYSIVRVPAGDAELVLFNVHLSAYGADASIMAAQREKLYEDMTAERAAGNYVIAGGDYNHDMIGVSGEVYGNATQVVESWAKPYDFAGVPEGFTVAAKAKLDETGTAAFPDAATCRDAGRPYDGTNDRWVMDTFIYSDNVECLDCSTVDLDFAYSDHNPVAMTFKLR